MGDRLKYERFLWFHGRVKAGRYPNSAHLAGEFELSQRTAQRDIEFMRDNLKAPLQDYRKNTCLEKISETISVKKNRILHYDID